MSADNYLAIRRAKTVGKPELGAYWAILDGNVSTGHETLRDGLYKTRDDAIDAAQEILEREVIEYGISVIERKEGLGFMSDDQTGCGAHGPKDSKSAFDHTCDECMLPSPHLDPEDDPAFQQYEADKQINEWLAVPYAEYPQLRSVPAEQLMAVFQAGFREAKKIIDETSLVEEKPF